MRLSDERFGCPRVGRDADRRPWTTDAERWMRAPRGGLVPALRRGRLPLWWLAVAAGLRRPGGIYAWSRPGVFPRASSAFRVREAARDALRGRVDLRTVAPGAYAGVEPDLAQVVEGLVSAGWTLKAVAACAPRLTPWVLSRIRRGRTGASLAVALALLHFAARREPPPPPPRLGRAPFPVLPARGMGPSLYRGFVLGPQG